MCLSICFLFISFAARSANVFCCTLCVGRRKKQKISSAFLGKSRNLKKFVLQFSWIWLQNGLTTVRFPPFPPHDLNFENKSCFISAISLSHSQRESQTTKEPKIKSPGNGNQNLKRRVRQRGGGRGSRINMEQTNWGIFQIKHIKICADKKQIINRKIYFCHYSAQPFVPPSSSSSVDVVRFVFFFFEK